MPLEYAYCVWLLAILSLPGNIQAQKHTELIKPGEEWKDTDGHAINAHGGGILFYKKKYYWFGEYKTAGRLGNTAQVGVSCYSSKDLYNWKNEGVALGVSADSLSPIAKGCILERPKVVYNRQTKMFVMWFHLEPKGKGYGGAQSGVAISKNATGPYQFLYAARPDKNVWPVNVLPVNKERKFTRYDIRFSGSTLPEHPDSLNLVGRDKDSGQMARDMTVFVDDDNQAYHIYASEENSTLHISKLTQDYTGHSGIYKRIFPGMFREAPAVFKHNQKYYLITSGCTGWMPNAAGIAVADSMMGNWTILGNPCVGDSSSKTFNAQGTYILKVNGRKDAYIFMADRWTPKNPIDGKYVWLPVNLGKPTPEIHWMNQWSLSMFNKN
jgi:hypothetical protein